MLTRLRTLALPAMAVVILGGCVSSFEPTGEPGPGGGDPGGGDPPGEGDPGGGGEDPGGDPGGEDPGTPPPPAEFDIAADTLTADLALGETKAFSISVTSVNAFAGPVTVSALDLPASWTVTFSPSADVTVPANGVGSVMAIVEIPTDAEATTANVRFSGTGTPGTHETPVAITVKPELTLHIPAGSVDNPDNAFGPGGRVAVRYVAPGTKVRWVNDDTVPHRIHATDGGAGLDHQPNNMGTGGSYEVTMTQRGTFEYNCHIHAQMRGVLVVE